MSAPVGCSECGAAVLAKGLCARHYQQRRRGRLGKVQEPEESERLDVRVPVSMRAEIERAAARAGVDLSTWTRRAIRAELMKKEEGR